MKAQGDLPVAQDEGDVKALVDRLVGNLFFVPLLLLLILGGCATYSMRDISRAEAKDDIWTLKRIEEQDPSSPLGKEASAARQRIFDRVTRYWRVRQVTLTWQSPEDQAAIIQGLQARDLWTDSSKGLVLRIDKVVEPVVPVVVKKIRMPATGEFGEADGDPVKWDSVAPMPVYETNYVGGTSFHLQLSDDSNGKSYPVPDTFYRIVWQKCRH
jgi:hypothetical protein